MNTINGIPGNDVAAVVQSLIINDGVARVEIRRELDGTFTIVSA